MTVRGIPKNILYSSFTDPKEGFAGYCASTPPDWVGERTRHWPGRLGVACTPFQEGRLRPERLGDHRGRGLFAGVEVRRGSPVCEALQPLCIHQYEESRLVCESCAQCHRCIGSLREALNRPLQAAGAGSVEDFVDDATDLHELETEEWELAMRIPCQHGCGAVFCSESCVEAADTNGWHRELCSDLPTERRVVWRRFQEHAVRWHETFIMAAQVIAEIVCLVRHFDVDLFEAMAFFTRFAKMSWLNLARVPSRSNTEGPPVSGKLAQLARQQRAWRVAALTTSLEMLCALLWEPRFDELLTIDFYANLVGQFSLSNVWVQIEHPLTSRLWARANNDPAFRNRFSRLVRASAKAARRVTATKNDPQPAVAADDTASDEEQKDDATIWALPIYQASALYNSMALTNHSCRPNYMMTYADGAWATMRALRDIAAGEELSLAYVSPSFELTERLANLWEKWGFVCTCQKCQDEIMARVLENAKTTDSGGGSSCVEKHASTADDTRKGYPFRTHGHVDSSSVEVSSKMKGGQNIDTDGAIRDAAGHVVPGLSSAGTAAMKVALAKSLAATAASRNAAALPGLSKGSASQSETSTAELFRGVCGAIPPGGSKDEEEEEEDEQEERGQEEDEEDEGNEEEEEEEGEEESGSSVEESDEDTESDTHAALRGDGGIGPTAATSAWSQRPATPLWPRGPPRSVMALEADLKDLMEVMMSDD